jgi:hypothetical protein
MAIGHAGDPDTLSTASHRDAERAPRIRRAIGDSVFDEKWGRRWGA